VPVREPRWDVGGTVTRGGGSAGTSGTGARDQFRPGWHAGAFEADRAWEMERVHFERWTRA
jgi:hypothetical protein